MPNLERIVVYIDGFNLYFGLKHKQWRRFYWLDQLALAQNLLKPHQQLVKAKYFTSRITSDPPKEKRQSAYLDALASLDAAKLSIHFGKYQSEPRHCPHCRNWHEHPNEKMTDVNIAVEVMADAFQQAFDTAILVSADSDLVGPVAATRRLFPGKRVVVAFPPDRYSRDLAQHASAWFKIRSGILSRSLLPDPVVSRSGFAIQRPESWQ